MQHLYDLAETLGVQIEYTDLTHLGRAGDYCHTTRIIRVQHGLLWRKHRSVLAHELAHAMFGDEPTIFEHINDQQERRADEHAAHMLITPDQYRDAEAAHDGSRAAMAQELGVLEHLVNAYEKTLTRLGDTVYVRPRMGEGQWDQRIEVA